MQGANSRQYKREMASFEVGSENASTMAGSVLRDERTRSEGDRDEGRIDIGQLKEGKMVGGGFRKAEKKRSLSRTKWRRQFRVSREISFISDESNSIARAPSDRASASSLRRNVIGYAVNY